MDTTSAMAASGRSLSAVISQQSCRTIPDKDFQAISQVGMSQCIVAVTPSSPIKSVRELIDYARKNPDKLTYGASNGSINHVSAELFKMMTDTKMVHVSYKSGALRQLPISWAGR